MLNRQIPNLQSHLHHQSAYLRRIDNPFERCPFAFFGHLALFVVGIDRSMEYWIQRTTRVRFSRSVIQDFNCYGVEPSAGGLTNATMDALDDWFQDEFVQSANYYHPRVLYFTSVRRSYFWTKLASTRTVPLAVHPPMYCTGRTLGVLYGRSSYRSHRPVRPIEPPVTTDCFCS